MEQRQKATYAHFRTALSDNYISIGKLFSFSVTCVLSVVLGVRLCAVAFDEKQVKAHSLFSRCHID